MVVDSVAACVLGSCDGAGCCCVATGGGPGSWRGRNCGGVRRAGGGVWRCMDCVESGSNRCIEAAARGASSFRTLRGIARGGAAGDGDLREEDPARCSLDCSAGLGVSTRMLFFLSQRRSSPGDAPTGGSFPNLAAFFIASWMEGALMSIVLMPWGGMWSSETDGTLCCCKTF